MVAALHMSSELAASSQPHCVSFSNSMFSDIVLVAKISHGRSFCTVEISKCYKLVRLSVLENLLLPIYWYCLSSPSQVIT